MKRLLILFIFELLFSQVGYAKVKDVIRVSLRQKELHQIKSNISTLLDSVELKPYLDGGGNQLGVRIMNLNDKSFLHMLGFKAGDIILQDPSDKSFLPIIGIIYEKQSRIYIRRDGDLYLIRTYFSE